MVQHHHNDSNEMHITGNTELFGQALYTQSTDYFIRRLK